MTEAELLSKIESEEKAALGYFYGDLSKERSQAIEYYHGNLYDVPSTPGRSDVISTDVRDAVDGMLPDLLDVFLSSDEVCVFEPKGPEDEEACKQATDVVNHIFYKQNNGSLILYEWFKTALLEKNGIVKYWWEDSEEVTQETYQGLTQVEYQNLVMDENVTVTSEPEIVQIPQMPGIPLYNVSVEVKRKKGKTCVKGIPPEEFLVCSDHASLSLQDARFVAHRSKKTEEEVEEMGGDVSKMGASGADNMVEFSPEWNARRRYYEERDSANMADTEGKYWVTEAYYRCEYEGRCQIRHVCKVGNQIFVNEEADHIPFAAICPVIIPYRFYGLSIADLVTDIMKTKSVIMRQMLDSLYLANNARIGVMESMVNLDDLLVSRPGGIIRFKTNPSMAMMPIETKFVGQQAFPMLEYQDALKETRTGFTRQNQGLEADSLNKTAHGMQLLASASAKRMKLIARMFAETGMKDLFRGILHMTSKYNTKAMTIRLRNKWVDVDPRQWNTGWDVTVNVGLGTGDKSVEIQKLLAIFDVQSKFKAAGMDDVVTDQNLYTTGQKISELSGYKNQGQFFTPPKEGQKAPPPPPPELIKIQAQAQTEKEKIASAERIKAAEMQNGQQIAKIQSQTNIAVAKIKAETDKILKGADIEHDAHTKVFDAKNQRELAADQQEDKKEAENEAISPFKESADNQAKMHAESMGAVSDALKQLAEAFAKPRRRVPVRDAKGDIVAVEEQ